MGLFDFFKSDKRDDNNRHEFRSPYEQKRESWDYGSVSERHFGKDRYGYHHDEESMYSDDERYDGDDF